MELAQKYAYTVYQEKSFSKAAQVLFISQPSLSAMVKKLENELGFLIFDRSKNPLLLTPQGEIYIEYLEECFENERIMQHRVRSLSNFSREELSIGGGSFLSRAIFPKACQALCRELPNVSLKIDMGANGPRHNIKQKLDRNLLDIAISYTFDKIRFTGIPILEEKYFLALRRELPGAEELAPYSITIEELLSGKAYFPSERSDYRIPPNMFLLHQNTSHFDYMLHLQDFINEFSPSNCYITNVRSSELSYEMMLSGLGCVLVTDVLIAAKREKSKDVLLVPVNVPNNQRTAYIIHKRGAPLSESAKKFISIVQAMCKDKKALLESLLPS